MKTSAWTILLAAVLPLSTTWAQRPDPAGPANWSERQDAWNLHRSMQDRTILKGLEWRSVGPVVQGGRVVDIEVSPEDPYTFYVAYASGGLWRTTNNGVTFEPIFDHQPTIIMGDIAVDPTDGDVIWVGTGENNSSRSSYGGAGVFRSEDGGNSWRYVGLGDGDRIGRILIDPRNPNRVLVAVLGKLYTPGGDRGVYLTEDAGATWERVLAGGDVTGFTDLVMDPSNADVIYAAAWERSRRPWNFVEGGEGSAIWKSVDGGTTWRRLAGGFPRGDQVGRIGLAVSASDPSIVYASLDNQEQLPEDEWDLGGNAVTPKRLRRMSKEEFLRQDPEEIESFIRGADLDPTLDAERLVEMIRDDEISIEDLLDALQDANQNLFDTDIRGIEVWRSDDGGGSWRLTHEDPITQVVYTYGYYFGQIRVAPDDPDRVYIVGVPMLESEDGGRSWARIDGRGMHVDHHAVWINPESPDHMIVGNDGGIYMSYDGGITWLTLNTVAVGQFYTIEVDMADPYNVYGGLQDNGVLKGSSRSRPNITEPWERIGGGDGMYVQVDPRDNATVYRGFQFGNYFRQGPAGFQRVKPRNSLQEEPLRYNWATPIQLSEHNPDILYFGANKLFRSFDQGETFTALSDDLTRNPNRGDVPFGTITTISESPLEFGLIWVGTDDGYVHVTRGGGAIWTDVSAGLPRDRWITRVESSHHEVERAYVSMSGYRDDDITAYVYRTEDLGRTWRDISDGLPAEPVNVIKEDPVNPDVLYLGTDKGAYVSLDGGDSWITAGSGLPTVPVHDLVVHPRERELVAGTHGRSVWILDVLPVQELNDSVLNASVAIFPIEPVRASRDWRSRRSLWFYRPEDDPFVNTPFWVRQAGEVTWTLLDEEGRELRNETVAAPRGVNNFRWNLLVDRELALAAEREALADLEESERDLKENQPYAEAVRLERPLYVIPGTYTVRVTSGSDQGSAELEIKAPMPREPRVKPEPRIRGEKRDRR